ncbi:LamG-like jellyroll fold domain-containing protein [Reichenbachiella versicolor]|uniref:LamG-like jellyroll fold domain-containing protein n=1 Tax=Reichenbachiella versicolor TaxID=1821036 RepID=UPI000D6E2331|nr:gliding motility-associated C-terminal domain-containing protein [Reichenbachiella versicolor]
MCSRKFKFVFVVAFLSVPIIGIAQPSAPTDFWVTSSEGQNELFWTQNPLVEGVIEYKVYRSDDNVSFSEIAVVPDSPTPSYQDKDVLNGQQYYYHVTASDGTEGAASVADVGMPVFYYSNFLDLKSGRNELAINSSDELQFQQTSFSMSFWVYVESLPGVEAVLVTRHFDNGGSPIETFSLRLSNAGELYFREGVFNTFMFSSSGAITVGDWNHIGVSFTATSMVGGNVNFYVNGALVPLAAASPGIMSTLRDSPGGSMIIGDTRLAFTDRFLNGKVDELSIWDKALSAVEVQSLMCTQSVGDESDLVGLWHFNSTDGIIYDYSSNQNNALVTGTVEIDNFSPEATDDLITISEDSEPIIIDLQDNDLKFGTGILITELLSGYPQNGIVNLYDQDSIDYKPDLNFFGRDTVQYVINSFDFKKNTCPDTLFDQGSVIIDVNAVNDAPNIVDATGNKLDTVRVSINDNDEVSYTINANDIEGDKFSIEQITSLTVLSSATFSLNDPIEGSFTYYPDLNFEGFDSLRVVIADTGVPPMKDTVVYIIDVSFNDAPVILDEIGNPIDTLKLSSLELESLDMCFDISVDQTKLIDVVINNLATNQDQTFDAIPGDQCFSYDVGPFLQPEVWLKMTACDADDITLCDSVWIQLEVIEDLISQALSPNGDAIGDEWYIPKAEEYPDNKVSIYDQWGVLVYQERGYNNQDKVWRGQSNAGVLNGKGILPNGTYFYWVDYGGDRGKKSGFVVVRK